MTINNLDKVIDGQNSLKSTGGSFFITYNLPHEEQELKDFLKETKLIYKFINPESVDIKFGKGELHCATSGNFDYKYRFLF